MHIFKKSLLGNVLFLSAFSFAGGLNHNTNQSVDFVRNFAQDAATGAQAVYYNPAGLAFNSEGLHLQVHNQTIWQTRTIKAEGFGKYKGESFVPFMPSIFADYHYKKWNAFAGFMVVGGGGAAEFDDGLPMIDMLLGQMVGQKLGANPQIAGLMQQSKLSVTDVFDAEFEGEQYIYGFLIGGTYKINDMFSVALGARFNVALNSYYGEMSSTNKLENVVESLPSEMLLAEQKAGIKAALQKSLNLTLLDNEQSGVGITPIVSMHFHYKKLNAAIKYEHNTSIEVENDTEEIAEGVAAVLPQFLDSKKTNNDMPGFLSVGASYAFLDWLRASVGYHHYFDQFASYANGKEEKLHHDEKEAVFGVEVDPIKILTLSLGVQRTLYGVSDEYIDDISFNLPSWSFGGGFSVQILEWLRFQAGYMITLYEDWNKTENLGTQKIKKNYDRTSHNIGFGFNFDL